MMQTSTPIIGATGTKPLQASNVLVSRLNTLKERQEKQRSRLQESLTRNPLNEGDESGDSSLYDTPTKPLNYLDKENCAPKLLRGQILTRVHSNSDYGKQSSFDSDKPKPRFPFLKKGEGIKRFNYDKRLKFKQTTKKEPAAKILEPALEYTTHPKQSYQVVSSLSVDTLSPIIKGKLNDTQGTETFEVLEKFAEQYSFSSNASVVDKLFHRKHDIRHVLKKGSTEPMITPKKQRSVQFQEQGAQILEYPLSEEETVNDNSTELNMSEVEFLARRPTLQHGPKKLLLNHYSSLTNTDDSILTSSTPMKNNQLPEIAATSSRRKGFHQNPISNYAENPQKRDDANPVSENKDLETQKILLISKVEELNREIKTFQRENSQLAKLKTLFQRDKELWDKERISLEESLRREKLSMARHFENEVNNLHRIKTVSKNNEPNPENKHILEIIDLKEEIIRLKQENSTKDSKFFQSQKKWKQKIFELQQENDEMKEMQNKYSVLKKENIDLKHQLDRAKLASKLGKMHLVNELKNSDVKAIQKESTDVVTISPVLREASSSTVDSPGLTNDSITITSVDGSTVVKYANGNKKTVMPTGVILYDYYNGDKKEVHRDKEVYTYGSNHTRHTVYKSGMEELEYSFGQKEITKPDGSVEIIYPDKTKKCVQKDGSQVYHRLDGTVVYALTNGEKVLELSNGQLEYHGANYKKREYPDGSMKVVYSDGRKETIYPDGKVKVKHKN